MADQKTGRGGDPFAEVLATSGLVTMLGAVLAAVIAIVTFGHGDVLFASLLGLAALVSFAISVACFFSDSNRVDDAALPFPSWLRTDADPAPELAAS